MVDIFTLFTSWSFIKILIGTILLGLASGLLGMFITFKKKALLGDVISHTVLPGIVLSYMWFQITDIWVMWIGVIGSSLVSLFLIYIIPKYSKIKIDTVLALILSSFFGAGQVLMCHAQKTTEDNSIATLEKFILGHTASITKTDLIHIMVIAIITLGIILFLWKEFKIFTFDELYAKTIGFNNDVMIFIMNFLLIGLINVSLKVTGIILTSTFLILPGAIAIQISNKLSMNVIIIIIIAFLCNFVGVSLSAMFSTVSTGPVIVVTGTLFFIIAFLFGNNNGILKKYFQQKKYQKQIIKFSLLIHYYNHFYEKVTAEEVKSIPVFLFEKNYLNYKNNKIRVTSKGKQLVENLIDGNIK